MARLVVAKQRTLHNLLAHQPEYVCLCVCVFVCVCVLHHQGLSPSFLLRGGQIIMNIIMCIIPSIPC